MIIKEFDPWKNKYCTCPKKYSLNVYTGCKHGCLYCYASSYVKDFFNPRIKKNFKKEIDRDVEKLKPGIVMISPSTDPYQPLEIKYEHTKYALEKLFEKNFSVLLLTKSILFLRDKKLLEKNKDRFALSLTVTTINEDISKKLEPSAPRPIARLKSLKKINVPKILRIDPIIPYINDNFDEIEEILKYAKKAEVKHIIFSTYKARTDNLSRVLFNFSEIKEKLLDLYKKGEKVGNTKYLPYHYRYNLLKDLEKLAISYGFSVGFCRENIKFNAPTCDGTHLIKIKY